MIRRTTLWAVVALLGITASAALAWAASQLASQRVGLASEPLSVVAGLAPAASRTPAGSDPDQDPTRTHRQRRDDRPTTSGPGRTATLPTATSRTHAAVPPTTSTPAGAGAPALPAGDSAGAGTSSGGGSGDSGQGPDD